MPDDKLVLTINAVDQNGVDNQHVVDLPHGTNEKLDPDDQHGVDNQHGVNHQHGLDSKWYRRATGSF